MPTQQELHYMFDLRTSAILTAKPISVTYPDPVAAIGGGLPFDIDSTGGWIFRVPAGIDFNPKTANTLQNFNAFIGEKHSAILASYPGFSFIVFDDVEDATGFNTVSGASGVHFGGRGAFSLGPTASASTVLTNAVGLAGGAPDEAVLYLESFIYGGQLGFHSNSATHPSIVPANPKNGRYLRVFRPNSVPGGLLQFDVSFNNGSTFINNVFTGVIFNIPPADQGTTFILRITRRNTPTVPQRIGVGAWALVY